MHQVRINIEGVDRRKRATGILHVLSGCFLLISGLHYAKHDEYTHLTSLIPVLLIALASVVYGIFRNTLDAEARWNPYLRILQFVAYFKLGLSLSGIGNSWEIVSLFLWSVITLLLLFSERRLFQETLLIFREPGIQVPGVFNVHTLPWNDLRDVVLRNDYITVFRSNDKFLQFEVADNLTAEELQIMHAFCKLHLHQSAKTKESA